MLFSSLFVLVFGCLLTQTGSAAERPFQSQKKCSLLQSRDQEPLLKPSNYLSYLFASQFLIGGDVQPAVIERSFSSARARTAQDQDQPTAGRSLKLAAICSTRECQAKLQSFLKWLPKFPEERQETGNKSHGNFDVKIRVLVEHGDLKRSTIQVSQSATIFIEEAKDYTFKTPIKSHPDLDLKFLRRRGLEAFMEKYKDHLFLPESFFENPAIYFEFLLAGKEKGNNFLYVFWNGNFFSERIVLPGFDNYIEYVDLMTDAWDDWFKTKGGLSVINKYKEMFNFMSKVEAPHEFIQLVSDALVYKLLYKNHGENTLIAPVKGDQKEEVYFPGNLSGVIKKSAELYESRTYFLHTSKYLFESIFRSKELQDAFHNEHWSRFHQLKAAPNQGQLELKESGLGDGTDAKLKNLVMTVGFEMKIVGEDQEAFFAFFRRFDQESEIVLFIDTKDMGRLHEFSKKYNVILKSFKEYAMSGTGIKPKRYDCTTRFRAYSEYLKENPHIGRVLLIDLRDGLIQSDVFKLAPEFNRYSKPFILYNLLHDFKKGEETRDQNWLEFESAPQNKVRKTMFGVFGRVRSFIRSNITRVCAGTILGDRNSVQLISLFIVTEKERAVTKVTYDQTWINFYLEKWPHVFVGSRVPNGNIFYIIGTKVEYEDYIPNCEFADIHEKTNQLCYHKSCAPVLHKHDFFFSERKGNKASNGCKEKWNKYVGLNQLGDFLPRATFE